jgi:hypothetical protein
MMKKEGLKNEKNSFLNDSGDGDFLVGVLQPWTEHANGRRCW